MMDSKKEFKNLDEIEISEEDLDPEILEKFIKTIGAYKKVHQDTGCKKQTLDNKCENKEKQKCCVDKVSADVLNDLCEAHQENDDLKILITDLHRECHILEKENKKLHQAISEQSDRLKSVSAVSEELSFQKSQLQHTNSKLSRKLIFSALFGVTTTIAFIICLKKR